MALPRRLSRFFLRPLIVVSVLFAVALAASQIQQHVFRRRAELLLSQIRSLELRKTPWQDAQLQLEKWSTRRTFSKLCDAHQCTLEITLQDSVYRFLWKTNFLVKLDDYFRWKLSLHYDTGPFVRLESALLNGYLHLGGHPAQVTANVGMRDGVVWEKSFSVRIETYGHPAYWSPPEFRLEFSLIVNLYSVPRFQYSTGRDIRDQLYLHPTYDIGRPGGCTICVLGWARFTPYADPADVQRLMQLDLSCLTRWQPCVSQAEIMPAAWNQYNSELSRLKSDKTVFTCSPSILQLMGRDSTEIASAQITGSRPDAEQTVFKARVLENLKGSKLKAGDTLEWRARPPTEISGVTPRQPILLFLGSDVRTPEVDPPQACAGTAATYDSLKQVRHGIAQDYAAGKRTYPL